MATIYPGYQAPKPNVPNRLQRIIVKPQFDHGGGGIVVQQPGTYTFFDPQGNQLETVSASGRPGEHGIKVQSGAVASGLPQGSYFTGPDGIRYNLSGGSGQRHEFDEGQSEPTLVSNKGAGGSGSGGFTAGGTQTSVQSVPGFPGSTYVNPGGVDFGSVQFHESDWNAAMQAAQQAGDQAKIQYLQNIKDSQQPALDLVNTDIQGIKAGVDQLAPIAREQGNLDTQTNISRAGSIDSFNQSRLPGINSFNRTQIGRTNDFNRGQFEEAVGASGIDYRDRINDVLNALGTEATGKFGDPLLDNLISSIARGRGSDLASSTGVGSLSGAGRNIQGSIEANQRIAMAMQAQGMIPGIAGQAQQLLQPPLELAKTQQVTPTNVPLNVSNIGERVPIQANISAGATAQSIANTAQQYQAIGAPYALQTNLQNQQFNSKEQMNRDMYVANNQEAQILGQANAMQGGLNASTAADIRQQAIDAGQAGLDTASTNSGIQAGGSAIGGIVGGILSAPGVQSALGIGADSGSAGTVGAGNQQIGGPSTGTFDNIGDIASLGTEGIMSVPTSGGSAYPGSTDSSGTVDVGSGQSSGAVQDQSSWNIPADQQIVTSGDSSGSWFRTSEPMMSPNQLSGPPGLSGGGPGGYAGPSSPAINFTPPSTTSAGGYTSLSGNSSDIGTSQFKSATPMQIGNSQLTQGDYQSTMGAVDKFVNGQVPSQLAPKSFLPNQGPDTAGGLTPSKLGLSGPYNAAIGAAKDPKIDANSVIAGIGALTNWSTMQPAQQLAAAGQFGVSVLQNKGILSPVDAKALTTIGSALATIADPKAATSVKAASVGTVVANLAGRSFTGNIDKPTSVSGQAVTDTIKADDGSVSYKLSDGTVVPKSVLQATADAQAALGAYQVVMSNASADKKTSALQSIGVQPQMASDLVGQIAKGNSLSALSLFNTTAPWEHQTDLQKSASIMQVTGTIQGAASAALPSNYRNKSVTGDSILKGLNVNQGPSVQVGNASISPSGVNVNFYGVNVPVIGYGGNSVSAQDGRTGVSVNSTGLHAQTGASVGNVHATISAGASPTGVGVSPRVQIGNSPGAQAGAQAGGTIGGAIGTSIFGPVGGAVGGFIGSALGSVLGNKFGGGTSSQQIRNSYRSNLVSNGIAEKGPNNQVNVTLADGSKYDIGIDGGAQIKNKDGTDRFSYEVDWTNPVAADSIPASHILAIATGLDPSMTKKDSFNRIAGQLTNAISSNAGSVADSHKNAKAMLDKQGVTPQNLGMRIEALRVTNKISDQEYGVYLDQLNHIYGTKFQPVERQTAQQNFVSLLSSQKNRSKADKQFLETLNDKDSLSKNEKKTLERIASLKMTATGGLPTPDRYASAPTMLAPKDNFNIQQAL